MTEHHKSGHDNQKQDSVEDENMQKASEQESDIIELSDIAIGFTREDEAIVELTEELIGEAFVGFAGATSEVIHDDERVLDLSENLHEFAVSPEHGRDEGSRETRGISDEITGPVDMEDENLEADISWELDNYFGTDDDVPRNEETTLIAPRETAAESETTPPASDEGSILKSGDIRIASGQLDDAIERVIRKMFAEKINRILDDVIERTVAEEIGQLKDYLLGVSGKKK